MITRSFSKRILRNVSQNYDKNQLYYSTKECLESFYHIEQDFHELLQKELQPIRGKEYYQSEEFVRIYQKARKRFSANYNIIHMKNHQKSQKLEFEKDLKSFTKKQLKNKKNYYIIKTKKYCKFGKSECNNMYINLQRYLSDGIVSIVFIV